MWISIGLLACVQNAQALNFPERNEWGVLTQSLAGSTASVAGGLDSFIGNPATLGYFAGSRAMGGNYQSMPHGLSSWSIGVVDGTSVVTGGFHFQWTDYIGQKRLSYSSTVSYRQEWAWFGGTVRAVDDSKVPTQRGWHFLNSMGAIFMIPGGLSIGVYGKNFLDKESDSEFPPSFYSGLSYSVPKVAKLTIETSRHFEIPGQDWNVSYAGEFVFKEYYLLRGGYFWSRSLGEESFWSAGLGMQAQKVDFLFAYTQTRNASKPGYAFELSFRF